MPSFPSKRLLINSIAGWRNKRFPGPVVALYNFSLVIKYIDSTMSLHLPSSLFFPSCYPQTGTELPSVNYEQVVRFLLQFFLLPLASAERKCWFSTPTLRTWKPSCFWLLELLLLSQLHLSWIFSWTLFHRPVITVDVAKEPLQQLSTTCCLELSPSD